MQNVHTQVNFEGGGLRIGFEGQRRTPLGLVFYGRTAASLVAGTFRCAYTQDERPLRRPGRDRLSCRPRGADDRRRDGHRIVALERQAAGHGRLFVQRLVQRRPHRSVHRAVQNNNFTGMSNTLTFDGFVGRVELQF